MNKDQHSIRFALILIVSVVVLTSNSFAQRKQTADKKLLHDIDRAFVSARDQYKLLMNLTPDSAFPKTFDPKNNRSAFSNSGWWCSGFYPGTLLNLYKKTNDTLLYEEAIKKLQFLQQEQYNTHTHDLGFMMYCSFGKMNEIHHTAAYDSILLQSARSLCTRFDPVVGCIKSWDGKPGEFLVIIDNMMNLELLFWATKFTGDSSFYKIAVTHANNTIKNHFRADHSSYHVINYDAGNGKVLSKKTAQGAADSSAWARGQAWGLYGFTVMYRETHDMVYLQQAKNIVSFILNHPNLPADKIPYWDFNAPGIPNTLRDASAAAIISAALLELSSYVEKSIAIKYLTAAETILHNLLSPAYTASLNTNGGFILKHAVGHKPQGTEIDVPLTYADYYFVEAMMRYEDIIRAENNKISPAN